MDTSVPLVSIVVPVFNTQQHIHKCIESLQKQTLEAIEIICIDDGSTDESPQIVRELSQKDTRIKLIQQANAGAASARNKGLEAAQGQYVMFCDSDDWYEEQACEGMLNTLMEQQVRLVVCDCLIQRFDDHTREGVERHLLNFSGKYELDNALRLQILNVLWNKIFDLKIIRDYKIRFPLVRNSEDITFVMCYLSVIESVYGLAEKLYNYTLRQDSLINAIAAQKARNDSLCALAAVAHFFTENDLWQSRYDYFIQSYDEHLRWVVGGCEAQQKDVFLSEAQKTLSQIPLKKDLKDPVHSLLNLIVKGDFKNARRLIEGEKIFFLLGQAVYRVKYSLSKNEYKYYLLGLRFWKRKLKHSTSASEIEK